MSFSRAESNSHSIYVPSSLYLRDTQIILVEWNEGKEERLSHEREKEDIVLILKSF